MYSIGEVSKMFHLSVSTIRYYDSEGLIQDIIRSESGIRKFTENSLESIRVIECLKKSGMPIKEIKNFMEWCQEGNKTLQKRKEMFLKQKENIEQEIKELEKNLNLIEYKCWYYEEALKDGNELRVRNISLDKMPGNIQKVYQSTHS